MMDVKIDPTFAHSISPRRRATTGVMRNGTKENPNAPILCGDKRAYMKPTLTREVHDILARRLWLVAGAMFCMALLFALGVVRCRDYDMPETHHEVNPPAPMIEAYGSYQGS
jgi:hypothetical protein